MEIHSGYDFGLDLLTFGVYGASHHHDSHHATHFPSNFAEALVFWDKLFGTYTPATQERKYPWKKRVLSKENWDEKGKSTKIH